MAHMPDDRFEARLRALAQQLSRSISEVDLNEVADRLGVDADRVRGAAGAVEDWLNDRADPGEPLFSSGPGAPHEYEPVAPFGATERAASSRRPAGPHPLDLPSDDQGRTLSALDSGRWTVRPGSGQVSSSEPAVGPPPPDHADLAGELRARDWITADGTLTLAGRQALERWCRTAGGDGASVAPHASQAGAHASQAGAPVSGSGRSTSAPGGPDDSGPEEPPRPGPEA